MEGRGLHPGLRRRLLVGDHTIGAARAGPTRVHRTNPPGPSGRFFGGKILTASPGDGVEIYLVRNDASWQGIEFRPPRRSSFYFFTRRRGIVLKALAEAGFAVSAEPGRERLTWYQPDDD
jgi:hypothetical protein